MSELITDPDLTPEDIRELQYRAFRLDPNAKKGTAALARSIGVTTVTINQWLNGEHTPDEYRTARLIDEYGVPSRFEKYESVGIYTHRGENVTLAFTFIGDNDKVTKAITNVKQKVTT